MTTVSTIKVQLKQFDIHVSEQDILTQVSEFNPYPEQANQGILIWSIYHPTTNPLVKIKYPATGNMYATSLPLSYPSQDEIRLPTQIENDKAPQPMKSLDGGESHGHWMTLTEYMAGLANNFVRAFLFEGANLQQVTKAVVNSFDQMGNPIFEDESTAFIKLVQLAFQLLQDGQYHTAAVIIEYGTHTGMYEVGGENYSDAAYAVFNYATWQLALDICPVLFFDDPQGVLKRGTWSSVQDVAGEITGLVTATVTIQALRRILVTVDEPTMRLYLISEIERESNRLLRVKSSLEKRQRKGRTYLKMVVSFFKHHGIYL